MAKDDELKKSIKELVEELVSDTVYKLVKASAQKTVSGLKDKIKEEAAKRLEDRLKNTAKELKKELTSDTAKDSDYVSKFKEVFKERFQKLLTSLSKGPLKPLIIASACALVVGGAIGGLVAANTTESTETTPPQPDLVITEITFQMESLYTEEPVPEIEFPDGINTIFETFEVLIECPPSYQLTVHYVIENQGDKEAGVSTSCLSLCGEVIAEDTVETLAPGETSEESFTYYPFLRDILYHYFCYAYADIDIKVEADCGQSVMESNEENNSFTLRFNQPH